MENLEQQDLNEDHQIKPTKKAQALIMLFIDGLGIAPANEGNIFSQLKLKTIDALIRDYPVIALSPIPGSVNKKYLSLGTGVEKTEEDLSSKKELSCLSSIMADNSLKQLKIFESERFAPLSYFFNGLREDKLVNEDWVAVSSTEKNDKQSERKSSTKNIFLEINKVLNSNDIPDFITVSVSGIDALAREGNLEDLKKEILLIDKLLKSLVEKVLEKNVRLLLSSSLGNAEKMIDIRTETKDNSPTLNPVPLFFIGQDFAGLSAGKGDVLDGDLSSLPISGSLIDLAPTILEFYSLDRPSQMKGVNLASNLV